MCFFPLPLPAVSQTALSIEQRETAFAPHSLSTLSSRPDLISANRLFTSQTVSVFRQWLCVRVSSSVIQRLVDPNSTQDLRHAQWQERPSCPNTNKRGSRRRICCLVTCDLFWAVKIGVRVCLLPICTGAFTLTPICTDKVTRRHLIFNKSQPYLTWPTATVCSAMRKVD